MSKIVNTRRNGIPKSGKLCDKRQAKRRKLVILDKLRENSDDFLSVALGTGT